LKNYYLVKRQICYKMDFHPSQIPIEKTFDVKDEKDAESAAKEMVRMGFINQKKRVQSVNAER